MNRDFLRYIHIAVFIFLGLYMSGCTKYYTPAKTNYDKNNQYYNRTPQTKAKSSVYGTKYYSKNSAYSNYKVVEDGTNNRRNSNYNSYPKSVNNANYKEPTNRTNNNYDRYNYDNNKKVPVNRTNNNYYYNNRNNYNKIPNNNTYRTNNSNRNANDNNIYNKIPNDTNDNYYSRPAVVTTNFTNDPRYEYHMDKRRFFYRPRPKIPYYYMDGIYYYGGHYSNGSYEYNGATLTRGKYYGIKSR